MMQLLHREEFQRWLAAADGRADATEEDPTAELLAEHHLMTCVLVGIEQEAGRLVGGSELRREFWSDAIDFLGNFVHRCHRVKEELHYFPAAAREGRIDPGFAAAIAREHANAKDMTLSICDGYGDGDWEKVSRLVSLYTYLLRPHMEREERAMAAPSQPHPDDRSRAALAAAFRDVEAEALQGRGRRHYVDVARRICAGLPIAGQLDPLPPASF